MQVGGDLPALALRGRQRPLEQGGALGLVARDAAGERHGDRGLDELQQQQRADGQRDDPQDQVVRRGLHPVVAQVDLEGQRRLAGQPQRRVHLDQPVAAGDRAGLRRVGDVRADDAAVDRGCGLVRDRDALTDLGDVVGVDHRAGAVPHVELGDRPVADAVRDGPVQLGAPGGVAGEHLGEQWGDDQVRGPLRDPLGVAQRLVLGDLPADEHGADGDHDEDERCGTEVGDEGAADPRVGPDLRRGQPPSDRSMRPSRWAVTTASSCELTPSLDSSDFT